MVWPYTVPPARDNLDPQLTDHPDDHNTINAALTELLTVEQGNGTPDAGASSALIRWARFGNMVTVSWRVGGAGGKNIGTIPAVLAPDDWIVGSWWAYTSSNAGTGVGGSCRIGTSGNIFQDAGGTVPSGGLARGRFAYMIGEHPAF